MTDAIGLLAATLVLATFSMKTMLWLRLTAIASNIAFIWYGVTLDLVPIWGLHAMLLPMNLWRCALTIRDRREATPEPATSPQGDHGDSFARTSRA